MTAKWIAWRIIREIVRDRRTIAFLFLVPLIVMTLIYFSVAEDESVDVGVETRGLARLFDAELMLALEADDTINLVELSIPDEELDPNKLKKYFAQKLKSNEADAILYFEEKLLTDRFNGLQGTLHVFVEGSRPTITALALSAIAAAMDDLAASMPTVIDASCSAECANSVNSLPMDLEKHYIYGSEDYRTIDYFLPTFAPFFVFFFTFLLSTITFQRERLNGTLERLLVAPVSFSQIIAGYVMGFFVFASVQAAIILIFVISLISFSVTITQLFSIAVVTILMMLIGLLLGLLASFLSRNEFQAVQFIPLVILPQIFLSDMIWDIKGFPFVFQMLSLPLPLTHANSYMRGLLIEESSFWSLWPELMTLTGFVLIILSILMFIGRKRSLDAKS